MCPPLDTHALRIPRFGLDPAQLMAPLCHADPAPHLVRVQGEVCVQQLPHIVVGLPLVHFVGGVPNLHVHGTIRHPLVLEALGTGEGVRQGVSVSNTACSEWGPPPPAGPACPAQSRLSSPAEGVSVLAG